MKKLSIILASAMLACLLTACGNAQPSDVTVTLELEETSQSTAESTQSAAENTQTDILYAYFGAEDVREYPIEYTGDKKNAEELANELSALTGLDFNITSDKVDDGLTVDWAADSTLVAGLDDRVQKDEFFFFDHDTLSWFMMDSLWRTLTENLDTENIYYTMNGGEELVFDELYPVREFPSDVPYMGSDFYFAHSDVQGDEDNLYARTEGLWRLYGATDTASIEMDGLGGFTMYYASGSVEASGYLECVDEYEDGNYRYDFYKIDGEFIGGFYFDSDTQFHIGNDDGAVYILDTQAAVQGDEDNLYARTEGLWRLDGATDTASIEMDGYGVFTMYYAGGTVEDSGYLECVDEYEDGNYRYDGYNAEGECIISFYFDSDIQFHIGNDDGGVYILDTQAVMRAAYLGFWEYPDGMILEINGEKWNTYESGESTPFAWGPVEYDEEAAYLMNEDGSSGGGKVYFDENNDLIDSGNVLTYLGDSFDNVPKG